MVQTAGSVLRGIPFYTWGLSDPPLPIAICSAPCNYASQGLRCSLTPPPWAALADGLLWKLGCKGVTVQSLEGSKTWCPVNVI